MSLFEWISPEPAMSVLKRLRQSLLLVCLTGSFLAYSTSGHSDIDLPTIGDASSSIVSMQREQQIGAIFMKMLHGQVKTEDDPELVQYTENLVYRLAEASQLKDRQLSIVLIDNPNLNAFAAPGGVIGINTGLFFYARTEDEFAGVIAHELAHLSQRHYARGVESAQQRSIPTIAAILGSIALAASGAGDLGAAALSTTLAGAQSSQLSFTRTNEREADRIGMLTLARSGLDPRGMPNLFERMNQREGSGPQYEFLRTHPLSRNRIADARSRSEQYPAQKRRDNTEYEMMRNRAILKLTQSEEKARNRFRSELEGDSPNNISATRYALAQAELDLHNPEKAQKALKPLLEKMPHNNSILILNSRIQYALGNKKEAIQAIRTLLNENPGNHPLAMALVDLLYDDHQYRQAMHVLKNESRQRPEDPAVWYYLAETAGLAKDIATVHTARAEYFFLVGDMDSSVKQLEYAIELPETPFIQKTALREKIVEVRNYKKNMKL